MEAKRPTIWTDEKAQPGRSRARKKLGRGEVRRGKIRDGESHKSEDAGAREGKKVAKHFVLPIFCGSGGSKRRLAKAVGAKTSGQMRN